MNTELKTQLNKAWPLLKSRDMHFAMSPGKTAPTLLLRRLPQETEPTKVKSLVEGADDKLPNPAQIWVGTVQWVEGKAVFSVDPTKTKGVVRPLEMRRQLLALGKDDTLTLPGILNARIVMPGEDEQAKAMLTQKASLTSRIKGGTYSHILDDAKKLGKVGTESERRELQAKLEGETISWLRDNMDRDHKKDDDKREDVWKLHKKLVIDSGDAPPASDLRIAAEMFRREWDGLKGRVGQPAAREPLRDFHTELSAFLEASVARMDEDAGPFTALTDLFDIVDMALKAHGVLDAGLFGEDSEEDEVDAPPPRQPSRPRVGVPTPVALRGWGRARLEEEGGKAKKEEDDPKRAYRRILKALDEAEAAEKRGATTTELLVAWSEVLHHCDDWLRDPAHKKDTKRRRAVTDLRSSIMDRVREAEVQQKIDEGFITSTAGDGGGVSGSYFIGDETNKIAQVFKPARQEALDYDRPPGSAAVCEALSSSVTDVLNGLGFKVRTAPTSVAKITSGALGEFVPGLGDYAPDSNKTTQWGALIEGIPGDGGNIALWEWHVHPDWPDVAIPVQPTKTYDIRLTPLLRNKGVPESQIGQQMNRMVAQSRKPVDIDDEAMGEEIANVAILDAIMLNCDHQNPDNLLIRKGPDGYHVHPIDYGLAFPHLDMAKTKFIKGGNSGKPFDAWANLPYAKKPLSDDFKERILQLDEETLTKTVQDHARRMHQDSEGELPEINTESLLVQKASIALLKAATAAGLIKTPADIADLYQDGDEEAPSAFGQAILALEAGKKKFKVTFKATSLDIRV